MKTLTTIDDIIDELGGTFKVADMLVNTSPQAVSNWRKKAKLPAQTYLPLKTALREAGCDAPDSLWRMIPLQLGQAS